MHRQILWVLLSLSLIFLLIGCEQVGCLNDEEGCVVPSPCEELSFSCQGGIATVGIIGRADELPVGLQAQAAVGDVLLSNDLVQAVIESVDHRNYLAPSGGNLLDLATRGDDNDSLTHMFLSTGILPGDAVYYEEMELVADGPEVAAVQLTGRLDGHVDARVYTRYEIRRCDPGIRMRTEIINLETEPALWPLYDTFFWAGKETQPFVPIEEMGFGIPDLDLEKMDEILFEYPFMSAPSHGEKSASYAVTACSQRSLEGFNDDDVSAMGLGRRIVPPRDYRVYERFIAVANGRDVASSADIIAEVREQLFAEQYQTLSGRTVLPDGTPVGGNEARVSVHIISEGKAQTPCSQVVPGPDGRFSARVPAGGDYRLDVWAFGRVVATQEATGADAGDIQVPHAARVELSVLVDDQPGEAMILFQPADEETREAVRGRLNGRFRECAPLLGAPYGPSPACNAVLVFQGGPVQVDVPVGRYHVYATAGPFATIVRHSADLSGQAFEQLAFELSRLPIQPEGTLSADLHVHSGRSFDSVFPERDRIISVLAASLDVFVATEHDLTHDYGKAISDLGAQGRLVVISGTEATGYVLFLDIPGMMIPKVIGHWNFWPLLYDPGLPHGGVPWTQLNEPGELFERMSTVASSTPVYQLNHPWEGDFAGRDQGWPRALELNLYEPLPDHDDGTAAGIFVRTPDCGPEPATGCESVATRNDAYHIQEVINGTKNEQYLQDRSFWFYLLDQGVVHAGTANSDSHFLRDDFVGSPRNIIYTDTTVATFEPEVFNQSLRDGRMFGTNGPVLEVATTNVRGIRQTPSVYPFAPASTAVLEIRVSAAPWVPVDEVRVIVNGKLAAAVHEGISVPPDPFGSQGTLRFQGEFPLADLLPAGSKDAYIVVEAGTRQRLFGDLNKDGVPDTTDNNSDGLVDISDVEEDDQKGCKPGSGPGSCGPLEGPPKPDDDSDPLYHFDAVIPGSYPLAFTNPLLLDRDGDGIFSGPGLTTGGE